MATLNDLRTALTQEQLQTIATEIAKPEYQNSTPGGIVHLLNIKPAIDNPNPQGEVNEPALSPGYILWQAGITLVEISTVQADAEGKAVWDIFTGLPEIDLNSQLATDCLDKLEAKGLLTTAKINAIKVLGKIPDTSWQAKVAGQNRTEVLLGVGWIIEGPDIRAAQAL